MARADEITEALKARLRAGEWQPGDEFPSRRALMREYSVPSTRAMQEALGPLLDAGVLRSHHGSGTQVISLEPLMTPAAPGGPLEEAERLLRLALGDLDEQRARVITALNLIVAAR